MAIEKEWVEPAWWDGGAGEKGEGCFTARFGKEGDGGRVVGVGGASVAERPGKVDHGGVGVGVDSGRDVDGWYCEV